MSKKVQAKKTHSDYKKVYPGRGEVLFTDEPL